MDTLDRPDATPPADEGGPAPNAKASASTPRVSASIAADLVRELQETLQGEVHADRMRVALYATDASIYQQMPLAVCLPRSREDVVEIVHVARRRGVPLLGRGAGTSLAGQTTATGAIVVDFSKYMNRVLEVNLAEGWARVEPGVVRDQLNAALRPHGLMFAPETATSNRANLGGMIANNSSGMMSIRYGRTLEHVLELEAVLADGSVIRAGSMDRPAANEAEERLREGLTALATAHRDRIEAQWPKVPRRAGGYSLDELLRPVPNLAGFLCGSEGTLCLFTEARVRVVPTHKAVAMMAVHCADFIAALETLPAMVEGRPVAIELIDRVFVEMARENPGTAPLTNFIEGTPEAVLFVETVGETPEEADDLLRGIEEVARSTGRAYAIVHARDAAERARMYDLRKQGLGIYAKRLGDAKPVSFVEDACIPLDRLAAYATDMIELCRDEGLDFVVYGHASVGVLHFKPVLNLKTKEGLAQLDRVSSRALQLVKRHGGCWSGEHGDGIVRGAKNAEYWSPEILDLFRAVKRLFDPEGLLNPGKIVDTPKIFEHQRYGPEYKPVWNAKYFRFRAEGGFHSAVEMCNGVGLCRQRGEGVMCPSYMATLDEEASTRGRANALRLAMSGQLGPEAMTSEELHRVLDLCLECKACRTECPNNVDMAKMKSEFLAAYHEKHGPTTRDRLFAFNARSAALSAGPMARLVNPTMKLVGGPMKKMLGIAVERNLPTYATRTFEAWWTHRLPGKRIGSEGKSAGGEANAVRPVVALFLDTYLNYYEPVMGRWLVRLLEHLGAEVELARAGCCGRPLISKGFLKEAKANGEKTMRHLDAYARRGVPVIVLEPSCLSALAEDLPDLIDDAELGRRVAATVVAPDKAIEDLLITLNTKLECATPPPPFLLHGHCHQKAGPGTETLHRLMRGVGADLREVASGCCGMAGSFGFEEEHYDLSMKIGEQRLFPAVRTASRETVVVANGFSCRHQIADGTGRSSMHFVEAFARAVLGGFDDRER